MNGCLVGSVGRRVGCWRPRSPRSHEHITAAACREGKPQASPNERTNERTNERAVAQARAHVLTGRALDNRRSHGQHVHLAVGGVESSEFLARNGNLHRARQAKPRHANQPTHRPQRISAASPEVAQHTHVDVECTLTTPTARRTHTHTHTHTRARAHMIIIIRQSDQQNTETVFLPCSSCSLASTRFPTMRQRKCGSPPSHPSGPARVCGRGVGSLVSFFRSVAHGKPAAAATTMHSRESTLSCVLTRTNTTERDRGREGGWETGRERACVRACVLACVCVRPTQLTDSVRMHCIYCVVGRRLLT